MVGDVIAGLSELDERSIAGALEHRRVVDRPEVARQDPWEDRRTPLIGTIAHNDEVLRVELSEELADALGPLVADVKLK